MLVGMQDHRHRSMSPALQIHCRGPCFAQFYFHVLLPSCMLSNVCLYSFYPHYLPTYYYFEEANATALGFSFPALVHFVFPPALFNSNICFSASFLLLCLKCRHIYIQLSSQSCALEANIDMLICGACILRRRRRRCRSRREIHSTGVCRL